MIYAKQLAQALTYSKMTVVCSLCQLFTIPLTSVHSPIFPSSLPQKFGSKRVPPRLLSSFWLSSASGEHREKVGENEDIAVDASASLIPALIQHVSGNVRPLLLQDPDLNWAHSSVTVSSLAPSSLYEVTASYCC